MHRSSFILAALLAPALFAQTAPAKKASAPKTTLAPALLAGLESHAGLTYARYGTRELQLDLHRPLARGAPLPAIVCIHGGGWFKGERSNMTPLAQALAARGYVEASDDAGRIAAMFVRCTSEQPSAPASARLLTALQQFRARYATAPDDAARLLSVGTVPPPAGIAKEELAAFTLVASAILNLDATVCLP